MITDYHHQSLISVREAPINSYILGISPCDASITLIRKGSKQIIHQYIWQDIFQMNKLIKLIPKDLLKTVWGLGFNSAILA